MALRLTLIKGGWFRLLYKGSENDARYQEVINSPQVTQHITFLNEEKVRIEIKQSLAAIGRDSTNNIIIDDSTVSRVHCHIAYTNRAKGWELFERQPKTPTRINREGNIVGLHPQESFKLQPGDRILLGANTELLVE